MNKFNVKALLQQYKPPKWADHLPHIPKWKVQDKQELGFEGNLSLERLCGPHMYIVPAHSDDFSEMVNIQDEIIERIKKTTGELCYHIPFGGSNLMGSWGYKEAFDEMIKQGLYDNFDDIVFPCGSGGTSAGIAVANYLTESKVRSPIVHGVIVSNQKQENLHHHINDELGMFGIEAKSEDIIDLVDGHTGQVYAINTQEDLDVQVSVSMSTGIMLDRVYTTKAVKGLVYELNNNPQRFKGNRILFIHTGGVFGLFDGKINSTLKTAGQITDRIYMSPDCKDPNNKL